MKLIKINTDHYIVVNNSLDFSETDYYWDDKQKEIRIGSNNHVTGGYKIKITHSTQPIEQYYGATDGTIPFVYHKIIELPLSEVKELIGEVDVEKKADGYCSDKWEYAKEENKQSFIDGYNQAIEDKSDKKYTNEDMLYIRNQLVTMLPVGNVAAWDMIQVVSKYTKWFDEYVESLQPKTEWEVEFIDGKLKKI